MTLLVLAAGMGSRYGGLKQIDPFTEDGEFIIDFSVYDAIKAGFDRVVFIIKEANYDDFRETIGARLEGKIKVEYAFQSLDKLVPADKIPAERVKPWGTTHAILCAEDVIAGDSFAVINADDFYGRDAYATIGKYLSQLDNSQNDYCMVGYCLKNTLSDYGTVSRGECHVDADGNLESMVERLNIARGEDGIVTYQDESGSHPIDEDTTVSMTMFGFTPDYFKHSEKLFSEFLAQPEIQTNMKAEFFIPLVVNTLINNGTAKMKVLNSSAQWFGVTYKEDKPAVMAKIRALIDAGEYPEKLWE